MSNLDIINLYRQAQQGGELPYFIGKQYGSGWLRTIGRFAFPILKRLGIMAADTAQDVLSEKKDFLPSLKENAMKVASEFLPTLFKPTKTNGNGLGVKRKSSKPSINKRRKMHGTIFR